jgi:serine kinase of HPr protein (carbohydrate metabolism regulator)
MTNSSSEKIHGTCVEVDGLGVLLCGPPGCGKSDLALRLIDEGARLVADDYTELSLVGDTLSARAPETIKDLIEVRGIGVMKIGAALQAPLGVVIDLVERDDVERLAEDDSVDLLGLPVARFRLAAFEASATAKVRLVVRRVKGDIVHVP